MQEATSEEGYALVNVEDVLILMSPLTGDIADGSIVFLIFLCMYAEFYYFLCFSASGINGCLWVDSAVIMLQRW